MKRQRSLIILPVVVLLLTALPACKRSAVEEPNPFGPSGHFLTFEVNVTPNVILTSDLPQTAEIRALVKWGGLPAENNVVIFNIWSGPGQFENYQRRTSAVTNQNGYAIVNYISPTKGELGDDTWVRIWIQPQTYDPYYVWKEVAIELLKGI